MEPHQYVGALFLAASVEHVVMIAAIVVGKVMRPPGRALVSAYLAVNGTISFFVGRRTVAREAMDPEVVVLGAALATVLFVLCFGLAFYAVKRALEGRTGHGRDG